MAQIEMVGDPLRLRVYSCLNVIRDISGILNDQQEPHPAIVEHLDRLDQLLTLLDGHNITEPDLDRIEVSINLLLDELGPLFDYQGIAQVYGHSTLH